MWIRLVLMWLLFMWPRVSLSQETIITTTNGNEFLPKDSEIINLKIDKVIEEKNDLLPEDHQISSAIVESTAASAIEIGNENEMIEKAHMWGSGPINKPKSKITGEKLVPNPDPLVALSKDEITVIDSKITPTFVNELNWSPQHGSSSFQEKFGDTSKYYASKKNNKQTYRQVLELISVTEDMNFSLGENVIAWQTVQKKAYGNHVLLGMTNDSVILVTESHGEYTLVNTTKLSSSPTSLQAFVHKNADEGKTEGVAIVSVKDTVIWISLGESFEEMTIKWEWQLNKNLTTISFFAMMNEPLLVVISEISSPYGVTSADIYRFDYALQDFWLIQAITLQEPCRNIATLDTGDEFILAFPQNNMAFVYIFKKDENLNRHFVPLMNITSERITTVTGFRVGGYSYLAVGGLDAQLFRYENEKFEPQTILSKSFGLVEKWLPISAKTYREDLILLVQHRIDFTTHSLSVVEALSWNGESFDVMLEVPCYIGELTFNFGITCMLDFDREKGMDGTIIIQHGRNISLLVPRHETRSGLFYLDLQLKSVTHPDTAEMDELQAMYDYFHALLEQQDAILAEAKEVIANALKPNEFNVINGHWKIDNLETVLFIDESENMNHKEIHFEDEVWTAEDSLLDVPTLIEALKSQELMVKELEDQLEYAIPIPAKNQSLQIDSPITFLGKVRVNGQFQADTLQVATIGNQDANELIKERSRKQRQLHLSDPQFIKNLNVQNLNFDFINDIPAEELVFNTGDEINLSGNLLIEKSLYVEDSIYLRENGTVNGIDLNEDIVRIGNTKPYDGTYKFENLEIIENLNVGEKINGITVEELVKVVNEPSGPPINTENVTIHGNLYFKRINGIVWDDFIKRIVMTNLPNFIENIHVEGDIIAHEDIIVDNLNGLPFPDGYLWTNGPKQTVKITGVKHFKNINVNEIDCNTLNGHKVEDYVTLSGDQYIPNLTTFSHVEVVESLEINGSISGQHLDEFLSNPTLLQKQFIQSACTFRDLEIQGNLIVEDTMNGVNLDEFFENVVYDYEEEAVITSFKTFENATFHGGITVTSNLVNGIHLDHFVTTDTYQELELEEIRGDIFFKSLELNGLFNFINVTELDFNSIKLFGDQYTEAELIFTNPDGIRDVDIYANHLEIREQFNGFAPSDLIDITENFELTADQVDFDTLIVDNLYLTGEIMGKAVINDVDLDEFERRRFSLSKPQTIDAPFHVQDGVIETNLEVEFVNDFPINDLKELTTKAVNLSNLILDGKIGINTLNVNGNVDLHYLNGQDFQEIMNNVVWLNKTNLFMGDIFFRNPIHVERTVLLNGLLNNYSLDSVIDDLVLKTDGVIKLKGQKSFTGPVHVMGDMNVNEINNIRVSNFLTKFDENEFNGPVIIQGNVTVNKLTVIGKYNDMDITNLDKIYSYDSENNTHIINANVTFIDHPYVEHLDVEGSLNNLEYVTDFLNSILMKNDQVFNIYGKKTFTGKVHFSNDVYIKNYNDIDLQSMLDNIVLNDENRFYQINSEIIFRGNVTADTVEVLEDVTVQKISGYDIDNWIENTVRIDQDVIFEDPIYFGKGTFKAAEVEVNFLNGVPISNFITLHTKQEFSKNIYFPSVTIDGPIDVEGLVNGLHLPTERQNTLMTYGDQEITAPTSFQHIRVLNSLEIYGLVNNEDFQCISTVHDNVTITAPVSFESVSVPHVYTKDLISGINFDKWYEDSLWKNAREYQTVTGNWKIENAIIYGNIDGSGLVNGNSVNNLMEIFNYNRNKMLEELQGHRKDYNRLCYDMSELLAMHEYDICFFRYFEVHYSLYEGTNKISSYLFFNNFKQNYLIYTAGCVSKLFIWNPNFSSYNLLLNIETGNVQEWIELKDSSKNLYLVGNSYEMTTCSRSGSAVWLFDGNNFIMISQLPTTYKISSLQHNMKKPGHFYALYERNNVVSEFDIYGNVTEEWQLPDNNGEHRFLPFEANLGLAVTDGKQISVMPSTKSDINVRPKRCIEAKCRLLEKLKQMKSETVGATGFKKLKFIHQVKERFKEKQYILGRLLVEASGFEKELSNENLSDEYTTKYPSESYLESKIVANDVKDEQNKQLVGKVNIGSGQLDQAAENFAESALAVIDEFIKLETDKITEPYESQKENANVGSTRTEEQFNDDIDNVVENLMDTAIAGMELLNKLESNKKSDSKSKEENLIVGNVENQKPISSTEMEATKEPRLQLNETVIGNDDSIKMPTKNESLLPQLNNGTGDKEIVGGQMFDNIQSTVGKVVENTMDTTFTGLNILRELESKNNDNEDDDYVAISNQKNQTKTNGTMEVSTLGDITTEPSLQFNKTAIGSESSINMSTKNESFLAQLNNGTGDKEIVGGQMFDNIQLTVGKVVENTMDTAFTGLNILRELESKNNDNDDDDYVAISSQKNQTKTKETMKSSTSDSTVLLKKKDKDEKDTKELIDKPDAETVGALFIPTYKDRIELIDKVITNASPLNAVMKIVDKIANSAVVIAEIKSHKKDDKKLEDGDSYVGSIARDQTSKIISATVKSEITDAEKKGIELVTPSGTVHGKSSGETLVDISISTENEPDSKNLLPIPGVLVNTPSQTNEEISTESHPPTLYGSSEQEKSATENPNYFEMEPRISKEIIVGGVLTTNNNYLPERGAGDIVVLNVGPPSNRRTVIAVSSQRQMTVPGHDVIYIYEDVIEGRLYQTLPCVKPSSLTTLHLKMQTLLIFLEGDLSVQVYIYKDNQGFTKYTEFRSHAPVMHLSTITLPVANNLVKYLLIVTMEKEILFLETKYAGKCGLQTKLNCDLD